MGASLEIKYRSAMLNHMKYTFLLPAYKAKYLKEALESIVAQTYTDWKCVVSDDCSPEDLKSIVEAVNDPRISYCRNDENIGGTNLARHWNKLVAGCESDYFIMAADDDLYDAGFLAQIDDLTEKYPEVEVLRARVRFIDAEGDVYAEDPAFEEYVSELKWLQQNYTPGMLKCMANFVFKTKPLQEYGGFIEFPLAWYSDIATVLAMGKQSAANTRDICFTFRMSGLNISSEEQTTKAAARKKLEASKLYDAWMMNHLQNLQYEHSKLNDSIYQSLYRSHKNEIVVKVVNYAKAIGFCELMGIIKDFRQRRYFDSGLRIYWVLKEWLKSRA